MMAYNQRLLMQTFPRNTLAMYFNKKFQMQNSYFTLSFYKQHNFSVHFKAFEFLFPSALHHQHCAAQIFNGTHVKYKTKVKS